MFCFFLQILFRRPFLYSCLIFSTENIWVCAVLQQMKTSVLIYSTILHKSRSLLNVKSWRKMIAFNKFEGNGNYRAVAYLRNINELRRVESKLWRLFWVFHFYYGTLEMFGVKRERSSFGLLKIVEILCQLKIQQVRTYIWRVSVW